MKTKFLSIILCAAALFAACDTAEELADGTSDAVAVQFASGGISITRTTADGNQWVADDAIGIFMKAHGETLSSGVYADAGNKKYKAQSSSATSLFSPFNGDQTIYYPMEGGRVNFVAYYPYTQSLTNYTYPVNVSDQSNPAAIDLLYSGSTTAYDNGSVTVPLTFKHALSRLVINVAVGDGFANLSGLTAVSIKGMKTTAGFDLGTGTLGTAADAADITPYSTGGGSYSAILLPTTLGTTHYVQFTVDGKSYAWQIDSDIAKLEAGKQYTYTVTISKTGLTVAPVEITDWTGTTTTGTAAKRGISTAAELVQFRDDWNTAPNGTTIAKWSHDGTSTGTIRLLADIDMSGVNNFTPIGNASNGSNAFSATFDGCGYTISNLTVSGGIYTGLFGAVNRGSISRVSVADGTISGTNYAGGIAGWVVSSSSVTGCSVTGGTVTTIGGRSTAGGIAGYVNSSSSVTGCSVTGGTVNGGNGYAGGIAGYVVSSSVTGCIAAPASVSGINQGVVAGFLFNSSITAVCYVEISGMNAVGDIAGSGSINNLMPFASAFGDFFTTGSPSPIDKMNTAISSSGYQWVAQASGVLPKIGKQ